MISLLNRLIDHFRSGELAFNGYTRFAIWAAKRHHGTKSTTASLHSCCCTLLLQVRYWPGPLQWAARKCPLSKSPHWLFVRVRAVRMGARAPAQSLGEQGRMGATETRTETTGSTGSDMLGCPERASDECSRRLAAFCSFAPIVISQSVLTAAHD